MQIGQKITEDGNGVKDILERDLAGEPVSIDENIIAAEMCIRDSHKGPLFARLFIFRRRLGGLFWLLRLFTLVLFRQRLQCKMQEQPPPLGGQRAVAVGNGDPGGQQQQHQNKCQHPDVYKRQSLRGLAGPSRCRFPPGILRMSKRE